ncbi:MAG: DedA family protein [Thermodesulfobacteriota bacterium]|jgi:membrane protein DedA with SNARE-associated domain
MTEILSAYLVQFTTFGLFAALVLAGLGAPIPEDLVLITAGVLAHQGVLDLERMIPILYVGVLTGDVIVYSFGRRFGYLILRHPRVLRFLTPARQDRIARYFARYGNRTVFLVRHLTVLRAPTHLIAGAMKMPGWQFLLWDGLAALVSVPVMVGIGYFFADSVAVLQHNIRRIEYWVGAVVIVVFIGYLLLRYRDVWWTVRRESVTNGPCKHVLKEAVEEEERRGRGGACHSQRR